VYQGPTLGWGVLYHGAKHLPSPADTDKPLILTPEQVDIVLRWYALDADTGEFLFRRGELEMAKGWGKSPFAAFLSIEEFVGPVVFDRWDAAVPGGAVGRPWMNPWVQIAAVSEDQTDNTYHAIHDFLAASEHRAAKSLGIDLGLTRLHLVGRPGVLEPVTAAAGSREGQRLTFAVLDETHLWTRRNGGVRLAGTLRRNAAKMSGRTFETTNAPLLGEKSVAEQSGLDAGVLHYARRPSVEPMPDWSDAQMLTALAECYGDSWWAPLARFLAEIRDPATSWDDVIRFYFNTRSAGAGRAVDPRVWDALARDDGKPAPGTRIGVGFDGSISQDATVIVGCTEAGYSFEIGRWERPFGPELVRWFNEHPSDHEWRVDRQAVDAAVEETFATWDVGLMLCDPPKWETETDLWAAKHGEEVVLGVYTNQASRFAPMVDRWLTGIREGVHTHDGSEIVTRHVKAAHLQRVRLTDHEDDGRTRYVLVKGDDHGRIDGAVADVLAFNAAETMPEAEPMREVMIGWG
jgi:hypothetical protein